MFHATIPPSSSWNPSQFAQSQGFVLATRDSPRLTAYIWNPTSGLTASFQPASDWGNEPNGLSARKQGGFIAVCNSSRWSVYAFDTSTGFGSLNYDTAASNVRAIKFSPYGNILAVATDTAITIYEISPVGGVSASSATTLITTVTSITDIDFAPDGSHFIVVGQGGSRLEVFPLVNRKNSANFGSGNTPSGTPTGAGNDSAAGDKKGFVKLSGRCQNGYYYYVYESDHNAFYGRITNDVPQMPSSINFGSLRQPFGLMFAPDKNLLVLTHTNEYGTYASAGTDVRSYALSDNVSNKDYEDNVGGFANQLGTSNRGGLAYNCTYMSNYSAIVLANWDNLGNTHPLTTLTIDSAGAFTEVTRPVASGTVNDGLLVDWL